MSATRQDAWSQDEDLLLAEVVLRHIREGGTQLLAFEEVGRQLSRTAAACGFRWNSYVRKQYKTGIELAKKQRKELKKQTKTVKSEMNEFINDHAQAMKRAEEKAGPSEVNLPELDEILRNIKALYEKAEHAGGSQKDLTIYEERIQQLEKQTYYLAAENEKLINEIQSIEQDYKALVEIMERARKMVVLKGDDRQRNVKV
ncbi:prespore-specific regulator [Cytobacillus horneckiae]|uniref:RsfA family transcriptional regulator n=1 Tax=Cytobacillus horneckiae TaxID=549687 RepID=A0A2N0ZBE3_9BACI|nr:RsfA family transcriptional regulator [Cytobacillus horneckiae]MBN6887044.1 RsfA family transcriptional regulator [Cytobacillus horneckiae]MCM3178365.1 RsfA family transcriptional regulator [Cytobacillus horneckiae]MEC1156895.1 RsfA family transcriptional regulator [Cytobacillus horneckiae]MED2940494.1 RsfA family transcriptional regulator [Cytobacillus horneckiae]PKG26828.1 RsfA family transcriptional regulator [Cytobacillus horneckiae]